MAGIRTFKSLLAAALALWASQSADLDGLAVGEIPRIPIVSTSKDNAEVILNDHLIGTLLARPALQSLLLKDPSGGAVLVRHPSGRPIEIKVVAGSKAGRSLISRWLVACIFDEAPRMNGADEGVVNLKDQRTAIRGRMRPGAQEIAIGSPWAPHGPVYDDVIGRHGLPGPDLLVLQAEAQWLNPYWWTDERVAQVKEDDEDAYTTDVKAQFIQPDESLIPHLSIAKCTGDYTHIPPEPGHTYDAAMDPATRGNAWAMAIGDRSGNQKRIVAIRQWQGRKTAPLKPSAVLTEIRDTLKPYGIRHIITDQRAIDELSDIAASLKDASGDPDPLYLIEEAWTAKEIWSAFSALRYAFQEGKALVPNDPVLLADLRMIRKRPTANGVTIHLPITADKRHCDYAPPVAKLIHRYMRDTRDVPPPEGTNERANHDAAKRKEALLRRIKQDNNRPWWDGGQHV